MHTRTTLSNHALRSVCSALLARAVLIGLFVGSVQSIQAAEFLDLSTMLGDRESYARAVSADGTTVIGTSDQTTGLGWPTRWTLDSGTPEPFLLPISGTGGQANNVSGDGEMIVGVYHAPPTGFLFSEEGGVGTLPGGVIPEVISADGSVIAAGSGRGGQLVRWTKNNRDRFQIETLGTAGWMLAGDISNDGSVIVGFTGSDRCRPTCEAFRWTESGLIGLGALTSAGAPNSRAFGVSAEGSTVVGSDRTAGPQQAFRWTEEGGMQDLGMIAGEIHDSEAHAVSANGEIVVGIIEQPFQAGFLWTAEAGMRRVEDVLRNDFGLVDQLTGWTLHSVRDISDDGTTIVGGGINPSGNPAGWVAILSPRRCDLNEDRHCNVADLDLMFESGDLTSDVTATDANIRLDLTADGVINRDDATQWLAMAAEANGFAIPYAPGDANLDGNVNALDLNSLALSWQQGSATWSGGDFTGEGTVDALDLNHLGLNWRTITPFEGTVLVRPDSGGYVQTFDEALGPDGTVTGAQLPSGWTVTDNGIESDAIEQPFPVDNIMPAANGTTSSFNAGPEKDPDRALALGVKGSEDDLAVQLLTHIGGNSAASFQLQFDVEAWDAIDGIRIGDQVFAGPDDPGEAAFKLTVDIDSGDGFAPLIDLGTITTGATLVPIVDGIVDGRADANRVSFDSGLVTANIPAGSKLRFRWAPDFDAATDGWIFGVDNVSLSLFKNSSKVAGTSVPEPSTMLLGVIGMALVWRRALSKSASSCRLVFSRTNTPSSMVAVRILPSDARKLQR